jgi:Ca2+-transporting ATPase
LTPVTTDERTGLTPAEAGERLRTEGFNELPSGKKRGFLAIALGVVKEPMFLLLVVSGALYAALGDLQEAFMLLGFVFVVMGITIYQERKTHTQQRGSARRHSPGGRR